jgi:hypothetical protein
MRDIHPNFIKFDIHPSKDYSSLKPLEFWFSELMLNHIIWENNFSNINSI